MTITIELNGVKVKKEIPTAYTDPIFTYKFFLDLAPCGNDTTKILSVFTGIAEAILKRSKIHNLTFIIQVLQFLKQDIRYILPLTINGFPIPKDLDMETIAQIEDIKTELGKSKDNLETLKKYPLLVATYCVDYTQENAWKKAEELAPTFLLSPCTEVLAIGNFTLVKLSVLNRNIKPHFRQEVTLLNRFRLAMTVLVKRLAFTIRYYFLKKKLHLNEPNSLDGQSRNLTIT